MMDNAKSWRDAIENLHQNDRPSLVRVCKADYDADRNDVNIRVGDELLLSRVTTNDIRIAPSEATDINDIRFKKSLVLPISYNGKFQVCPHHSPNHVFGSVEDLLEVYPFISDFIYPRQSFSIEGVKIRQYDLLQVVTTVQDFSTQSQFLEVKVVTKNTSRILLPNTLKVNFQQWNDDCPLPEADQMRRLKPRAFSFTQLREYFSSKLHPMKVKLHSDLVCSESSNGSSSPKSHLNKFVAMFQKEKKQQPRNDVSENLSEVRNVNHNTFPSTWWSKPLTIEPLHTVQASNANTGAQMTLPGNLNVKVILIDHARNGSSYSNSTVASSRSADSQFEDFRRSGSSCSDSSLSLQQFDVSTLLYNKSRNDAIVAMVTGGYHSSLRPQDALTMGSWIAVHRARRIRKLLLMSRDSQKQHFLVSAQYAGQFSRLPVEYEFVGEVPIDPTTAYVTGCTAFPVHQVLDPCKEGQYVWFLKKTLLKLNEEESKLVVECKIADSLDGLQGHATYPINLKGKFQKVEENPAKFSTQDLFKQALPMDIKLAKADSSIGFDPLAKKEKFLLCKIVSETTIIVEILRKTDEGIKSSEVLLEVPLCRSSLFVKEATPSSMCGVDFYPRLQDFKGLQKLPSVELLADQDVDTLQEASKHPQNCLLSPDNRRTSERFFLPDVSSQPNPGVPQKRDSGIGDVFNPANNNADEMNSVPRPYEEDETDNKGSSNHSNQLLSDTFSAHNNPSYELIDQPKPIPKPRKKHPLKSTSGNCVVENGHPSPTNVALSQGNGLPHRSRSKAMTYSSGEYSFV